jgi:23S rRNA pseudouridine955/2504/2580 synthase
VSASTILVEADENGLRLDRWFKRRFPALAHGPLEKLLRTGQVRVDGKRVKAGERVEAGQSIRIPPQLQLLPPAREKLPPKMNISDNDSRFIQDLVIHEDSKVIGLNKPSGLATQGGSGITRHVDGLLEGLQGEKRQRPRLVHRLDRDTSGVLLVARTQPAAAALSESLRRRDARKIYWALTKGVPKPHRGVIKLALAKESGFGKGGRDERMTPAEDDDEGAKSATTHYAVIGTAADEYAWVALRPVTGRTHQIRAHLAAIGTPIVGDFKYGGTDAKGKGAIADKLHLHARSIDIARPDGGRLQVTAPLSPHMLKSWQLLGFDPDDKRDPFPPKKRKK